MSDKLLVEIGTEELPPKALRALIDAFAEGVASGLGENRLSHGDVKAYASPRRLALIVDAVADSQPDREVSQKGPPVSVAFADDGSPKPPALAFAKKCGVDVGDLGRTQTDKGEWLSHDVFEPGLPMTELITGIIERALLDMPIPRRMRWGAGDIEFVRPVHWVVLLHGETLIETQILGVESGTTSRGHRFHSDGALPVASADRYVETLEKRGYVIADMERRRQLIVDGVRAEADKLGGTVVADDALYDEVTALVEWPVPITGRFEERFLELPREVVVSTLTGHQRYFPVETGDGNLMPAFITVANIESRDPSQVIDGNERVIRPRLADAAFFWNSDTQTPLAARRESLASVVYQQGLGTLADKSDRVAALTRRLAEELGLAPDAAVRAAELCKCDLVTGMVGEFPDLQGIMGGYYAEADGEDEAVAIAIREQYQPRFAGDDLPATDAGLLLALADRIDTLAGAFALGKKPSGNRDPFGLRRAALGVVRMLIEKELPVDLGAVLERATEAQPASNALSAELHPFLLERLKSYCLEQGAGVQAFEAVLAAAPRSMPDFKRRLDAVMAFAQLAEAESLAAANKRIGNILKKAELPDGARVDAGLLSEPAEKSLHEAMLGAAGSVEPLLADGDYANALKGLSVLKAPVDRFFDDVMVMADDEAIRNNRLALLAELRVLFSGVADISRLSIG